MTEVIIAKVLDMAFTALAAGLERNAIVDKVRGLEASGATPDEITDALQSMRQDSERAAQAKIDQAR